MPSWWPQRLSGSSSVEHAILCVCVFCLRAERQVDLTVAESYLVGIGYKLRLCSSFMLETSPGKVADGAEILTFNILRIFLFTLKRVFFN